MDGEGSSSCSWFCLKTWCRPFSWRTYNLPHSLPGWLSSGCIRFYMYFQLISYSWRTVSQTNGEGESSVLEANDLLPEPDNNGPVVWLLCIWGTCQGYFISKQWHSYHSRNPKGFWRLRPKMVDKDHTVYFQLNVRLSWWTLLLW